MCNVFVRNLKVRFQNCALNDVVLPLQICRPVKFHAYSTSLPGITTLVWLITHKHTHRLELGPSDDESCQWCAVIVGVVEELPAVATLSILLASTCLRERGGMCVCVWPCDK